MNIDLTTLRRGQLLALANEARKELRNRSLAENGVSSISSYFCPGDGAPLVLTWKMPHASHFKCPRCTRHWFHQGGVWQKLSKLPPWPPLGKSGKYVEDGRDNEDQADY